MILKEHNILSNILGEEQYLTISIWLFIHMDNKSGESL